MRETKAQRRERAAAISERMASRYPCTEGYLAFLSPFELLIAVMLSAQTTDAAVNKVTPELFRRWPTPQALAEADAGEVESVIRTLGFHKTKARRCVECAAELLARFGGEVPKDIDELQKLPGIGRKSANCVMNDAFGIAQGVAVDTHVGRLARRLGFSKHDDPEKVERDILEIFPQEEWGHINRRWIAHGRAVCTARKPKCKECFLSDLCPSANL